MAYLGDNNPIVGTRCNQLRACQSGICGRSRREVLSTLVALGVSAFVPGGALIAQTSGAATKSRLIDVHHHILPPVYLAEARDRLIAQQQGYLPARILNWSPQNALAEMDQNGVATSIVSISTPGIRGCAIGAHSGSEMQRIRGAAGEGIPRPLRFLRFSTTPRYRRQPTGDRIRSRCAQSGWNHFDDKLW